MTTHQPLTNDEIDQIRKRLNDPALTVQEARDIALRLLADNDEQYAEADGWRESYRLAKGLSNDEIGAIIAVRDASKAHPRPCWFPHEACVCDDQP